MTTPHPDVRARALATLRAETIEKVRELAVSRERLTTAKAAVDKMERGLYESPEYVASAMHMEALAVLVDAQESAVKALALDAYSADPSNKKPAPGLGIRVTQDVEYKATDALAWCKEKGLFLIPEQVDVKALEKFLLTNESPITLEHTFTETPTVTIAKDLAAALAGEG